MQKTTWFVFSFLLFSISGCTVGTPSLSSLAEFSGITFSASKKTSETYTVSTNPSCTSELTVTGQCDQRFNQIQFSIDNESTWTNVTGYNSGSDGDCADGEFKIYFPNVCSSFSVTDNSTITKKIQVRGDKKISQNVTREAIINFTTDSPTIPNISISDAPVINEGGIATFTVTLDSPTSQPVTVNYSFLMGTATAGDFSSLNPGVLTFAAGETSKSISATANSNTVVCEAAKTFFAQLSNPSTNAVIADNQGQSAIEDTDRPTLSFLDTNSAASGHSSILEGNPGALTVTLSQVCPLYDVTFKWNTADNQATLADSDYLQKTAQLATITKGSSSTVLNLPTTSDLHFETNELFNVVISDPTEASITAGQETGDFYILNDDSQPNITITSSSFNTEGSTFSFSAMLSAKSYQTITVNYTISHSETTVADFDSFTSSGTITINPGTMGSILSIPTYDDTIDEPAQRFTVTIASPTNGSLGGTTIGTGTITDNDAEPSFSINDPSVTEGGNLSFTVTLSAVSQQSFSVSYVDDDMTATVGSDYVASSGSLLFPAGTLNQTVLVATTDDAATESTENFLLVLSNPNNYTSFGGSGTASIADNSGTGTILDNDAYNAPPFTLIYPNVSPGVAAQPKFLVTGVVFGEVVTLYSDNCVTPIGSGTVMSGTQVEIQISSLASPGTYNLKANRSNGSTSSCSATPVTYQYVLPMVEPTYSNASNWNDYVQYDLPAADLNHQGNVLCTGAESDLQNKFGGCIHAGERKKVVLPGFTSCSNLALTEQNQNFDWYCDASSGTATFFTKGLKAGKGLRNLIDSGPFAWKPNYIAVTYSAASVTSTSLSAWWSNQFIDLATLDNSATDTVIKLDETGKIYITDVDRTTYGYNLDANKVSIVTLGESKLKKRRQSGSHYTCLGTSGKYDMTVDDVDALLCAGSVKFIWVEANLDGETSAVVDSATGFYGKHVSHSRFQNTKITPMSQLVTDGVFRFNQSDYNLIANLGIHDSGSGVLLDQSQKNIFRGLEISATHAGSGDGPFAVFINGGSLNHFYDTRISNHGESSNNAAAIVISSSNNIFSRTTITNTMGNLSSGVKLSSASTSNNIFSQLIVAGTNDAGIRLETAAHQNIFTQVTAVNNSYNSVYFDSGTYSQNAFISLVGANNDKAIQSHSIASMTGNVLSDIYLGHNINYALSLGSSTFGTLSGFFLRPSGSGSCAENSVGSDLCNSVIGASALTSTFVTVSSDLHNPDDSNGSISSYNSLSYSGNLLFDSFFRGWGKDYANVNDSSARGAASYSLQIWDFSFTSGSPLYNRSATGTSSNTAINTNGLACTTNAISPTNTITIGGLVFLKNAIEIDGDLKGNDNSLCEAGEHCVYAPHIGGYQGYGTISSTYCTVDDGGGPGLDSIRIFTRATY
jgi:hypothetical protein